jgi:hypothetical protein
VKNYDFQAPLGAFGQTRPHYHLLRRMHLWIKDYGSRLAAMPSFLPELQPGGSSDVSTLRWAVRSDGEGGFLFVNNHQRGATLTAHEGVQFAVQSAIGVFTFPSEPIKVLPGASFIWPFRLDVGGDVRLESATAQLICKIDEDNRRTLFIAQTPGIPTRLKFRGEEIRTLQPGRGVATSVKGTDREIRVVLLDEKDSLALWKGEVDGRERVVLSEADVIFDQGALALRSEDPDLLIASIYPPLDGASGLDGVFGRVAAAKQPTVYFEVKVEQVRQAGQPREIALGRNRVAAAPGEEDFYAAAVWKLRLPEEFDPAACDALVRIHYRGDVARVKIGDTFVLDDFYNGQPLEIALGRFASELRRSRELTLEILPLRADAPIYLSDKPAEGNLLTLESVALAVRYRVPLAR